MIQSSTSTQQGEGDKGVLGLEGKTIKKETRGNRREEQWRNKPDSK